MSAHLDIPITVSLFPTAFPKGPALGTVECLPWSSFSARFLNRREGDKDGINFVPAKFRSEQGGKLVRRLKENVIARTAIALDIETNKKTGEVPPSFAAAVKLVREQGWTGAVYTSHSHTNDAPRYRIVIPLSAEIAADTPAVEVVARQLGLFGVLDTSKLGPASLFYFPSAQKDHSDHHAAEVVEGEPLDADWLLDHASALQDERDAEQSRQRAVAMEAAERRREEKIKAGFDPNSSLIEKVRDRLDLASELTGHGYQPAGKDRYLYSGSTTGIPGVHTMTGRDGVQRVFSHHAADPLADGNLPPWCKSEALDVVDVVVILDHGGDLKAGLRALAKRCGIASERPKKREANPPPPPPEPEAAQEAPAAAPQPTAADMADDTGLVTEDSVAIAFARVHKDDLRFDHHVSAWFRWTGAFWKREETKLAFSWARHTARRIAKESDNAKAMSAAGKASFSAGVERFAQADRAFAVTSEIWDADPWLLGTPGGTVDLRTGELRLARQADYITKQTAIAPAAIADCPQWLAFLDQATAGDKELVGFLRRWFGYTLTGSTREHALLFVFGDGGNGKGVAMNTVAGVMGDYAVNAAMDSFTATKGDKHPTDMAMLAGARMVMTTEVDEGQVWAEARLKSITGGDPITARFMRQDFFTFVPAFKLTVSGNHKPALRNVDAAARRRFNLAPFLHRPPSPDKELPEKLRAEWPGILRWMIDGCLEWQRDGLMQPEVVKLATEEYFEAQDVFGAWMQERCIKDKSLQTKPGTLLADFNAWAEKNGENHTTRNHFRGWIERQDKVRYKMVKGVSVVEGIGLKLDRDAMRSDQGGQGGDGWGR